MQHRVCVASSPVSMMIRFLLSCSWMRMTFSVPCRAAGSEPWHGMTPDTQWQAEATGPPLPRCDLPQQRQVVRTNAVLTHPGMAMRVTDAPAR